MNVTGYSDWSPVMTLAVTGKNKASTLNLHLSDAGGTSHVYRFDLGKLKPNEPQQLVAITARRWQNRSRWRRRARRPA